MSTAELKKELMTRISKIDDIPFLNALKTILDFSNSAPFIDLTIEEEKELLKASEEGKNGNYIE